MREKGLAKIVFMRHFAVHLRHNAADQPYLKTIFFKKLTGDSNVKPSLRITGEEKLRNLRIRSEP